jgi:hypothetical protein
MYVRMYACMYACTSVCSTSVSSCATSVRTQVPDYLIGNLTAAGYRPLHPMPEAYQQAKVCVCLCVCVCACVRVCVLLCVPVVTTAGHSSIPPPPKDLHPNQQPEHRDHKHRTPSSSDTDFADPQVQHHAYSHQPMPKDRPGYQQEAPTILIHTKSIVLINHRNPPSVAK